MMVLKGLRVYGVLLYFVLCYRVHVKWLYPNFKDFWGYNYPNYAIVFFALLSVIPFSVMFVNVKWKDYTLVNISEEDMLMRTIVTVFGLMILVFLIDSNSILSAVMGQLK